MWLPNVPSVLIDLVETKCHICIESFSILTMLAMTHLKGYNHMSMC